MNNLDDQTDFELLMNTLPAMLATAMTLITFILKGKSRHTAELYRVHPGRLEKFVENMQMLSDRRDRQRLAPMCDSAGIVGQPLFIPTFGNPAKEQIMVDDESDEIDRRIDVTENLYRQQKMLDQILAAGRTLIDQASRARIQVDGQGTVTAVFLPSRVFDVMEGYYLSPIINGWRPGEFRHVEAGCALDEARGRPSRTVAELFPNDLTPRLMPRASELRASLSQDLEIATVPAPRELRLDESWAQPGEGGAKPDPKTATEPLVQPQFAFEF